jgi:hypothetical protein
MVASIPMRQLSPRAASIRVAQQPHEVRKISGFRGEWRQCGKWLVGSRIRPQRSSTGGQGSFPAALGQPVALRHSTSRGRYSAVQACYSGG